MRQDADDPATSSTVTTGEAAVKPVGRLPPSSLVPKVGKIGVGIDEGGPHPVSVALLPLCPFALLITLV